MNQRIKQNLSIGWKRKFQQNHLLSQEWELYFTAASNITPPNKWMQKKKKETTIEPKKTCCFLQYFGGGDSMPTSTSKELFAGSE